MQTATTQAARVVEHGIRCRRRAWDALRKSVDCVSDAKLADAMNVNESTVYRTLTGTTDPSPKFMAHALHAFPFTSFDKLFELYAKGATR